MTAAATHQIQNPSYERYTNTVVSLGVIQNQNVPIPYLLGALVCPLELYQCWSAPWSMNGLPQGSVCLLMELALRWPSWYSIVHSAFASWLVERRCLYEAKVFCWDYKTSLDVNRGTMDGACIFVFVMLFLAHNCLDVIMRVRTSMKKIQQQ